MAYTITITYTGPANPENISFVSPICPIFVPSNSYIDTPAYKGTVYDTHTKGYGSINLMEPYASTSFPFPVPLTQFKLAIVGEDDGNGGKKVTFDVDSYQEAFWYTEAGVALAGQGFTVEVKTKA
mgnify:CR=1 FL=1|nr:MAG TPA: hypothetical protein [Caudoviricetes sp.]